MKINRVPDSLKDYVCTKFGQNPLKDVDIFTSLYYPLANEVAKGYSNATVLP
jgi:hypothetical protein